MNSGRKKSKGRRTDGPSGETIMCPHFAAVNSSIMVMLLREGGGGARCFDVHARSLTFAPLPGPGGTHSSLTFPSAAAGAGARSAPPTFPSATTGSSSSVLGTSPSTSSTCPRRTSLAVAASWTPCRGARSRTRAWTVRTSSPTPCSRTGRPSSSASGLHRTTRPPTASTEEENGSSEWRHHGGWALPFRGRGTSTATYVCACELVSSGSGYGRRPAWKLSKEKLFSEDPAEVLMGATLVHMGGKSRFCLVECVHVSGEENDYEYDEVVEEDPPTYLLRVTTFSLKLDEIGDLMTGTSRSGTTACPKELRMNLSEYSGILDVNCTVSAVAFSRARHNFFPAKSTVNSTSNG